MTVNKQLSDGEQQHEPEQPAERVETTGSEQAIDEPFPNAQDGATSASASNAATSTDRPPALPVASDTSVAALDPNWRCKCGRPSTRWPGRFCDAHHTIFGTPGAAVTTGLGAEHLPEAEDFTSGEYTDRRLTDLLSRHIKRLSAHLDSRQLRLADVPLVEKLLALVEKVEAREQPAVADDSVTEASHDAIAFSRRLANYYATEPDAFNAFIVTLVEADREKCGPLRQQLRLTLDALEPQGKPLWRGPDADDDTVLL